MAAILNGFLPGRTKERFTEEKILNTRWGDATITAPIPSAWSTVGHNDQITSPSTPPQEFIEDGIIVVPDDDDVHADDEKSNFTISIPLPWKKRAHSRKQSGHRFAPSQTLESYMSQNVSDTAQADSRGASPVEFRPTTASPILSFRERMTSPKLGDLLSPVQEDFAKQGPSSRSTATTSTGILLEQAVSPRPGTSSSIRSSSKLRSRASSHSDVTEGLADLTMTSQAAGARRIPSRRASSTQTSSRNVRGLSIDRGQSAMYDRRRAPSAEPVGRRAMSADGRAHRGVSVDTVRRLPLDTTRDGARASLSSQSSNDESNSSCSGGDISGPERPTSAKASTEIALSNKALRRHSIDSPHRVTFSSEVHNFLVPPRPSGERARSQSRNRGLYREMADDYRLLSRDVRERVKIGPPQHSHAFTRSPALESNPPDSDRPFMTAAEIENERTAKSPLLHSLDVNPPTLRPPQRYSWNLKHTQSQSASTSDYTARIQQEHNILEALAKHHREEAQRYAALAKEGKKAAKKEKSYFSPPDLVRKDSANASGELAYFSDDPRALSAGAGLTRKSPDATRTVRIGTKQGLVADAEEIWG